jgi:hypothetical protein
MAGYSKNSLCKKLGLEEDMKMLLINAPDDYAELVELDISSQKVGKNERPNFVHLFVTTKAELEKELSSLLSSIKPTTIIWVSWYKKAAKIPTDVTEDVIREIALKSILVDVKVCAVTDIWSGLKLVVRKENREF